MHVQIATPHTHQVLGRISTRRLILIWLTLLLSSLEPFPEVSRSPSALLSWDQRPRPRRKASTVTRTGKRVWVLILAEQVASIELWLTSGNGFSDGSTSVNQICQD